MLVSDRRFQHRETAIAYESLALAGAPGPGDEALRAEVLRGDTIARSLGASSVELGHHWDLGGEPRRAGLYLLLAATACEKRSRFSEGLSLCRRAIGLFDGAAGGSAMEGRDPLAVAAVEWVRLRIAQRISRYDDGLAASDRAYRALATAEPGELNSVLRARVGMALGFVYFRLGRNEDAVTVLIEARALARAEGARAEEATGLNNLATVHSARGEYEAALPLYEASLAVRRALDDSYGAAACLNNIAAIHDRMGNFDQTLRFATEALERVRAAGDLHGVASTLQSVGSAHLRLGNFAESQRLLEESLAIRREVGDPHGVAASLGNLGNVYWMSGDYLQAMRLQRESLSIERSTRHLHGVASSLVNLGAIQIAAGEYEQGMACLDESIEMGARVRAQDILCEAFSKRALARHYLGDAPRSIEDAEKAIQLAELTGYASGRIQALISLSLVRHDASLAEQARADAIRQRDPYSECEALLAEAEIRAADGNSSEARRAAATAAEIARPRGMMGLVRRADLLLEE